MESFDMSDESFKKAILELLIRLNTEVSVLKETIFMQASGMQRDKFSSMQKEYIARYKQLSPKVKEMIFANYGKLELDDIFGNEDLK